MRNLNKIKFQFKLHMYLKENICDKSLNKIKIKRRYVIIIRNLEITINIIFIRVDSNGENLGWKKVQFS